MSFLKPEKSCPSLIDVTRFMRLLRRCGIWERDTPGEKSSSLWYKTFHNCCGQCMLWKDNYMKAIVYHEYGSPEVLKPADVDKPSPSDDELLIKVHAVSVNRSDWEGLVGKPLYARVGGLRKPSNTILGSDIAGRVEMVGKDNKEF